MANRKYLNILEQGVEAWNQWRQHTSGITPDPRIAKIKKVNLRGADLSEIDLSWSDISNANLSSMNLNRAYLRGSKLKGANLSGADLKWSNLSDANLQGVNLQHASLQAARLINATLNGANLTGSCLWATQRTGWSIEGVICEYAYWDEEAQEKTFYQPGEFERLFAEKTKIRLFYKNGISTLEVATLPALIQRLEEAQGCALRFISIHEDSGGAVVELAVEETDNLSVEETEQRQAALTVAAQQLVEAQQQAFAEREVRLQLEGEVRQLNLMVDKLLDRPTYKVKNKGELQMGDTNINHGQAAIVGRGGHAHDNTFNQQVNHVTLDLTALAKELSELREALVAKQDASPQTAIAIGKLAEAEVAAAEKDEPRVLAALKSVGKGTLEFAKEVGKGVVAEAIKRAMGVG